MHWTEVRSVTSACGACGCHELRQRAASNSSSSSTALLARLSARSWWPLCAAVQCPDTTGVQCGMNIALLATHLTWTPYFLTKSMKKIAWEANSSSACQISRLLWESKVHCRADTSLIQVPILGHINPLYTPILLWSSHLRFLLQSVFVLQVFLPTTCMHFSIRATCLPHLFVLHLITLTISGEQH